MATFNSPWEGLLAGLGSGIERGAKNALTEQANKRAENRKAERERQQMIDMFRQRNAMNSTNDTVGTPQDRAGAAEFLAMDPNDRAPIDAFLDTQSSKAPIQGRIPEMFLPQETRGAMAARTLKQTPRELGTPKPPTPRSSGRWDLNMNIARAMRIERDKDKKQNRRKYLTQQQIRSMVDSLNETKRGLGHGELTDDEISVIERDAMRSLGEPGGVHG